MVDFVDKLLQHLTRVPETEEDVYNALKNATDLRLAWFNTSVGRKREILAKLQKLKFEKMMFSNVDDDGC